MLLTCATCGSMFVFTVEEQRRLFEAGLPLDPPTQCPRCAPRAALPESPQLAPVAERAAAPPARGGSPRSTAQSRLDNEFAVHYTVRAYGHVKWFDPERGEGVIVDDDDGREYHVRRSGIEGSAKTLTEGQAVEYEVLGRGREAEAVYVLII